MSGRQDAQAAMEVSQYKVDYQPWQLERTQRVEMRPQWEPPTGRVDGRTETSEQFPARQLEPRWQREKPEWRPPTDRFSGESVNRTDYLPKYLPKEQPVRPRDEIERATAPFAGVAGSREEFRVWEPQPRHRHEYPSYQKPDGSMQTLTSYTADFPASRSLQQIRLPPIRPAPQQQPSIPFRGVSESSERFRGYETADITGAKQPSCKPQLQYRPPSKPLDSRSSYTGDFVIRDTPVERTRPVVHAGELQLGAEPMETRTTNKRDFSPPEAPERRQPIKHGGQLYWPSGEQFQGHSTQRDDFSPRWQPRRQLIRHGGELQVSLEPFAGSTVMQDDFVARPGGERSQPVRPPGELRVPDAPMVSTTTSRDAYTPKVREGPPPRRMQQGTQLQVAAHG